MEIPQSVVFVQKVPSELIGMDGSRRIFKPAEINKLALFLIRLLTSAQKGINREFYVRDSEDGGLEIVVDSKLDPEEEEKIQALAIKNAQSRVELVMENAKSENPTVVHFPEMVKVVEDRKSTAELKNGLLLVASNKEAGDLLAIQSQLQKGPVSIGDKVYELNEKVNFLQAVSQTEDPVELEVVLISFNYRKVTPSIKVSESLSDGSLSAPFSVLVVSGAITNQDWIDMVDHLKVPVDQRKKMRVLAKISRRFEEGKYHKVCNKITITQLLLMSL